MNKYRKYCHFRQWNFHFHIDCSHSNISEQSDARLLAGHIQKYVSKCDVSRLLELDRPQLLLTNEVDGHGDEQ